MSTDRTETEVLELLHAVPDVATQNWITAHLTAVPDLTVPEFFYQVMEAVPGLAATSLEAARAYATKCESGEIDILHLYFLLLRQGPRELSGRIVAALAQQVNDAYRVDPKPYDRDRETFRVRTLPFPYSYDSEQALAYWRILLAFAVCQLLVKYPAHYLVSAQGQIHQPELIFAFRGFPAFGAKNDIWICYHVKWGGLPGVDTPAFILPGWWQEAPKDFNPSQLLQPSVTPAEFSWEESEYALCLNNRLAGYDVRTPGWAEYYVPYAFYNEVGFASQALFAPQREVDYALVEVEKENRLLAPLGFAVEQKPPLLP